MWSQSITSRTSRKWSEVPKEMRGWGGLHFPFHSPTVFRLCSGLVYYWKQTLPGRNSSFALAVLLQPLLPLSKRSGKPVTMSKRLQISIYRMRQIAQAWWMGCPRQRCPSNHGSKEVCALSMWLVRVIISPWESHIVKVKANRQFFFF